MNSSIQRKRPAVRKLAKGRPTAAESQELDERIQASALDHFLRHGFEAATMDNIARDAGITKRTIYARYPDKQTLFQQVVQWALVQWGEVNLNVEPAPHLSLEDELIQVASLLLQRELNIKVVQLSRIATAHIEWLQTLERPSQSMTWSPRMQAIARILKQRVEQGEVVIDNIELASELFISLIIGIPTRLAAFHIFREPEFEQERIREAVRIFLQGVRAPA